MRLLYFAWVKERVGIGEETVTPPADVKDLAALVAWLRGRGAGYDRAFADLKAVRAAVNQEYVGFDHKVAPGDEVAFFPPMTGGCPLEILA
jgi:molybdopterin synthase sulfur carrier subunit